MSDPGFDTLLTIERSSAGNRDSQGRFTRTFSTLGTVLGVAAMRDFTAETVGLQPATRWDAVARFPHDTDIRQGDRVVIPATKGNVLAGTYDVVVVRDVWIHLRVFLERVTN